MVQSLLLLFLLLTTSSWANDFAQKLCDADSTKAQLLSPWKKKNKKYCTQVACQRGANSITREKCFYQEEHENEVVVTYSDDVNVTGPNLMADQSRAEFVRLHEEDSCFNACAPVKKKGLLKIKLIAGLERDSCRECFEKREHKPYDESFEYKEIGKRLYPSQKCFFLCRDPKGPIVTERKLSPACQQCVGANGLRGEDFSYMLNHEKNCFEVDFDNEVRSVPAHLCARPVDEIILTHYQSDSPYNLSTIFLKQKPPCRELDNRTNGLLYKRSVDHSHCDSEARDNSDRNNIPEKSVTPKSKSISGNNTSKQ
ncbi:MAG: hypothetical protein NDI69_13695 [Bacteriovoracaceae bacterium]|nr:hypothetical protein [Bacteriovoracaceae bacterium]